MLYLRQNLLFSSRKKSALAQYSACIQRRVHSFLQHKHWDINYLSVMMQGYGTSQVQYQCPASKSVCKTPSFSKPVSFCLPEYHQYSALCSKYKFLCQDTIDLESDHVKKICTVVLCPVQMNFRRYFCNISLNQAQTHLNHWKFLNELLRQNFNWI